MPKGTRFPELQRALVVFREFLLHPRGSHPKALALYRRITLRWPIQSRSHALGLGPNPLPAINEMVDFSTDEAVRILVADSLICFNRTGKVSVTRKTFQKMLSKNRCPYL
jgi:hypothetical protein